MDKQVAYQLAAMFVDGYDGTLAEFIDWLYDQGYVIESRLVGEDEKERKK